MNNVDKKSLIDEFYQCFMGLVNSMSKVKPRSVIGRNQSKIKNYMNHDQFRKLAIEIYIIHFIKYRSHIDRGDDSFLAEIDFKEKSQGDTKVLEVIIELVALWKKLDPPNKIMFLQHLRVMSAIAYDYLCLVDDENSKS